MQQCSACLSTSESSTSGSGGMASVAEDSGPPHQLLNAFSDSSGCQTGDAHERRLVEKVLAFSGSYIGRRKATHACDEVFSNKKSMSRSQKLTLVSMAMSNFSAYLAFSVIAPFFPQEATAKGVSDTVIGFIFGAFQLVVFIMSPVYGNFISQVGPKFMYLSGGFTCSVCIILFGFLGHSPNGLIYIVMCFLCRIVDANGAAMLTTASYAMVAFQFSGHVSLVLGIIESCIGLGFLVGPPLGGYLYSVGGYQLPFIVVGGVMVVSCMCSFFLLPSFESVSGNKKFISLLKIPDVILAFFLVFSATFALSFLEPTLSKHLLSVDPTLSTTTIGAIFLVQCAVYSITVPLIGKLCDMGYLKSVMIAGCFISSTSLLFLGPSPLLPFLPKRLWLIITSLGALGIGVGTSWIPTFQLTLNSATKNGYSDDLDTYGMVSGLFNCGCALGAFAGPSAAGCMAERVGFEWAVTFCAAVSLIMAIAALTFVIVTRINSRRVSKVNNTGTDDECQPLIQSSRNKVV